MKTLIAIHRGNKLAIFFWTAIFTGAFVIVFSNSGNAQTNDPGWPRTILSDGTRMEIYQLQVEKWENGKLEARAAIAVTEKSSGQSMYGAVWIGGKTTVDQEKRLVTLYDVETRNATFPSAGDHESDYKKKVSEALQQWTMTISLDRLLADIAITQNEDKPTSENLNNTPPKMLIRQSPAVLILIDGQPVMQKVPNTDFMRVTNSPAMIVLDSNSGQYFLCGDGYWMTAPAIFGPWRKADNPPESLQSVLGPEDQPSSSVADASQNNTTPEIIVSTGPAELIEFQDEPQFSPIEGTRLLYVTNTDSDVFLNMPQQRYYVLLSGRWFSAAKLDGPWDFVKGSDLPVDFARIPSTHPKAAVLASVPGTSEARDAVVAAQVPQTATVDRKKASFTSTFDGEPKFKHIEGTDMSYAENSPNDIIKARGKYFAVENGVWFEAADPSGPWAVADFVPPEIYSLPPNVPVYHAKYVYVYDSTPDYVYVGYLPGYFGAYVWDGVVVYGTGFYYPCWIGSFWWGCPWTWGFGFHYGYWGGGYFWRPWYPRPWYWHPWRGPIHPPVLTSRVLYNRSVRGPTTNRVNGPHTTAYSRWQNSGVTYRNPVSLRPPAVGVGRGVPLREIMPGRSAGQRPDVYAGRDGQVYSHRNDGWYRQNGNNWEKVQPVSPPKPNEGARTTQPNPSQNYEEMERNRQARIQGQNRVNQYHNISPPQRSIAPPPRMSAPAPRMSMPSPRMGGGGGRHR